jgi:hypothetical protein
VDGHKRVRSLGGFDELLSMALVVYHLNKVHDGLHRHRDALFFLEGDAIRSRAGREALLDFDAFLTMESLEPLGNSNGSPGNGSTTPVCFFPFLGVTFFLTVRLFDFAAFFAMKSP